MKEANASVQHKTRHTKRVNSEPKPEFIFVLRIKGTSGTLGAYVEGHQHPLEEMAVSVYKGRGGPCGWNSTPEPPPEMLKHLGRFSLRTVWLDDAEVLLETSVVTPTGEVQLERRPVRVATYLKSLAKTASVPDV